MKKFIRKLFKLLVWLTLFSILIPLAVWITVKIFFSDSIFSPENSPKNRVAIVFGAGLQRDGTPSPVLRDRVSTAVKLLDEGKVEKLLFSGDNRFIEYNEPGAMQAFALELGVDPNAIILDYAGRRTYDTCYRAKSIFKIDHAILVTQRYHLPRALLLCSQLGINAVGVSADIRNYSERSLRYWNFREVLATTAALWDIWVRKPLPVLGEEQPIFP
jgi:SanA protein